MQFAAHAPAQRGIDELVLLHPALAAEGFGDDRRGVVVAIAGQILDGDAGIRQRRLDQGLDLRRLHRHSVLLPLSSRPSAPAGWPHAPPAGWKRIWRGPPPQTT